MARLELIHGRHLQEYDVTRSVVIGRSNSCEIKVPSTRASRKHCRVYRATGGFFLEDLDSANGTLLNGSRVGRKLLKHNDIIGIGDVSLRFIDKREDPLLGHRFGKYQVVEKLGEGGEGIIYRARQLAVGKEVVLKIFHDDFIAGVGGAASLQHHADIRVLLQQENIVRTYDYASLKNKHYYVLGYLEGENLYDSLIRQGKIKPAEVVNYGLDIASALDYIHSFGVIHGDLKASSMTVTAEDRVVIHDLGILVRLADSIELTGHEDISVLLSKQEENIACLAYIAPEVFRRDRALAVSDIYALSALLYQLLTGKLPFAGDNRDELLASKLKVELSEVDENGAPLPVELLALLREGLSFDPADRPQSAEEFKERLKSLAEKKKFLKINRKREVARKESESREKQERASNVLIKIFLFFILLGLIAFFAYRQYEKYQFRKVREMESNFKLAQDLYRRQDFDKARGLFADVLENDPPTEIAEVAKKRLKQLMLSPTQLELLSLQERLDKKELSKSVVLQVLKRKLRSRSLSKQELQEYTGYIKSLGGDADIRYSWQKESDRLRGEGQVLSAYQLLSEIEVPAGEDLELAEYRRYREEVKKELNTFIAAEYSANVALIKAGEGKKATTGLAEIASKYPADLGWRSKIISYFAEVNLKQGDLILHRFDEVLDAISKGDAAGLQEVVFQLEEVLRRQPGDWDTMSLELLAGYLQSYQQALQKRLEVDPVSERGSGEFVEFEVGGRIEIAELIYKNGGYFALEGESSRELSLADITVAALEKLSPLFELNDKALIGAGIYFISRGQPELGKGYLTVALESGKDLIADSAADYLALTTRTIPLPVAVDIKESSGFSGKLPRESLSLVSAVNIGGSRIVWDLTQGRKLVFALSSGDNLEFEVVQTGLEISLGVQKLQSVPLPAGKKILELAGYWDKILIMSDGVVLAEVAREKIGELAVAPYSAYDNADIYLKIRKNRTDVIE